MLPLRPFATRTTRHAFKLGRRRLHRLPPYRFDVSQGMGDFLTPDGLKSVAIDYQTGLLDRINEIVQGTELENQSLFQTAVAASLREERALLFNYASQALNNAFFLDNLTQTPPSVHDTTPNDGKEDFDYAVKRTYGSRGYLISSMSAAAQGIFGSGWIWLVTDNLTNIGIIATYGAGTILVRSRMPLLPAAFEEIISERTNASQPFDNSIELPLSSPSGLFSHPAPILPSSGHTQKRESHSRHSLNLDSNQGSSIQASFDLHSGDWLYPLFCISVNEHAWLTSEYGIWGKKEYLKRFWSVLDWDRVSKNYKHWQLFTR